MEVNERIRKEQAEINELAKLFCDADNKSDRAKYSESLMRIIDNSRNSGAGIYCSFQKIAAFFNTDPNDIMSDLFMILLNYKKEKSDNFCAYIHDYYKMKCMDERKKKISIIMHEESIVDENGETIEYPDKDVYEQVETADEYRAKICSLFTKIACFFRHAGGKKASPQRKSYFRIFFTEDIMKHVRELNSTKYLNTHEVYDITDRKFAEYVAEVDYVDLESLMHAKMRKLSELIDGYADDGRRYEPLEPLIPGNRVIINYRYRSGIDNKKVAESNVSQFRNFYRDLKISFDTDPLSND